MYLLKKQFFRLLEIRNDSKYVDGLTPSEQYSYLSCILNESETNYSYNRFVLAFSTYSRSFLSQRFFMILNQESKINVKIQFVNLLIYLILFILSISISISFVPHTP
ncbi:hypothetical protein FACS189418_1910 [Clostridia bacterium]|nr:hypothetical protein FACS189418_1910 [Clostridia bacterium]